MPAEKIEPVSAAETGELFSGLTDLPALVLAISGGPDSTALLLLAARWCKELRRRAPRLFAVTIDHGLRPESSAEALGVGRLAKKLSVPHRTLRWRGAKPKSGLQQAARRERYRLLATEARRVGASHILTAHTRDDQAETVLIRLTRGSGVTGLAAMTRSSRLPGEEPGLTLVRPFLDLPKPRLVATLRAAGIPFADDPSNRDPRFTRARLRGLIPTLEREGLTPDRLALLARRLRRADVAIEAIVEDAAKRLSVGEWSAGAPIRLDGAGFAALSAEIALRLLGRAIADRGNEGPVELAKLEALHAAMPKPNGAAVRFRRTLAGAVVTILDSNVVIQRAPARRGSAAKSL